MYEIILWIGALLLVLYTYGFWAISQFECVVELTTEEIQSDLSHRRKHGLGRDDA